MAYLSVALDGNLVFEQSVNVDMNGNIIGGSVDIREGVFHIAIPTNVGGMTWIRCGIEHAVVKIKTDR